MLSPRIDHQIRLYGQRNFGQVPMIDTGTSKTLKIQTQGLPSFSFFLFFFLNNFFILI